MKKELVAETVLNNIRPATEKNGKRIAVKGSNPAALATAYDLLKRGYQVVIFEPSGTLLAPYIPAGLVPPETLALETDVLHRMGAEIRLSAETPAPGADGFDGVIDTSQIKVRQPARLTLEGHRLAEELNASLFPSVATNGNEPASKEFNSTFPRFNEAEKRALNKSAPAPSNVSGCLYCDCNAKTNCRLRAFATAYGVKNSRYAKVNDSEALHRQSVGNGIWFEPAKCIKCGLCVYNSRNGFTFKHRGFVMQVVLPEENAVNVEVELAEICPTGAIYTQNSDK
jgi:ferredoxin